MARLEMNIWELYPRREEITLQSVERLSEGVGVRLRLNTCIKEFSHFLYTIDNMPPKRSSDGQIIVRFEDPHKPVEQHAIIYVKAVSKTGISSKPHVINIHYYSREFWRQSGLTHPAQLIVESMDTFLSSSRVEDWTTQYITREERSYAQKKWGSLIVNAKSDYEAVKALAKSLIDDLEQFRGIPSDEMGKLSPFEQYERVMAGKDHVWCGNLSAIFSHACNALGIPCRCIEMIYPWRQLPWPINKPDPEEGYQLLLADGHGTTEIFSESYNEWIWIDLSFHILGAYLGEVGPLNLFEFYFFLNNPNRADALRVVEYDPTIKTERLISVTEFQKKRSLSVFKRDQQFQYGVTLWPLRGSHPEWLSPQYF